MTTTPMTPHPVTANRAQMALELHRVSLTLGEGVDRTDALVDINIDVSPGELVTITGRSGSGKSSLLNVAGGLEVPSSGAVIVGGIDLAQLSPGELSARRRRSIGYVFQDLNLIPSLTAAENISLPLELDGVGSSWRDSRTDSQTRCRAGSASGWRSPEVSLASGRCFWQTSRRVRSMK